MELIEKNSPVGLKNVGNSCYFTSIAQNCFLVDKFREEISTLVFPDDLPPGDIRNGKHELRL